MKTTSNLYKFNNYSTHRLQPIQKTTAQTEPQSLEPKYFSYRDFNISFGERLNRTPEEFYAQPFNIENMPVTVKKFLDFDFEEHHHMPPAQLQREAYKYIKIADNVEDVKNMYPDEPLFEKLRPFSETRATRGTLFLLRWDALTSNTPIFKDKNEKDLTVYFLKKVYLEGKTLKEINQDFEKDSTYEIKKELGVKDGKYFTQRDLASLGIRYPNLAYYNSFLATRADKEYIPKKKNVSSQQTQEKEFKETQRTVSEETKEKLSEAKKRWWSQLSQKEREAQIQRMLEGKELSNSIYAKYQGPIMSIAAWKAGFSERLVSVIAEKSAESEDSSENFSQKQREIMLEFWNKDTKFKRTYSEAVKSTIQEFESACMAPEGSGRLEKLLDKALEIKKNILERAKARQEEKQKAKEQEAVKEEKKNTYTYNYTPAQTSANTKNADVYSEKYINKTFKRLQSEELSIYPDSYKDEYLDFIVRKMPFKDKKVFVGLRSDNPKEYFKCSDDELEKLKAESKQKLTDIDFDFKDSHRLLSVTTDFVISKFLYELTKDPIVFKFEKSDLNECEQKDLIKYCFKEVKPRLSKELKQQYTQFSEKETLEFIDNQFTPYINSIADIIVLDTPNSRNNDIFYKYIKSSSVMLQFNDEFRKAAVNFFKNYKAVIKYLKTLNSDSPEYQTIIQKIVMDYSFLLAKFSEKP